MKLVTRITLVFSMLTAITIGDRVSKNLAREFLEYESPIEVFKTNIVLLKVENTGAFLNLGSTVPNSTKFLLLTLIPSIGIMMAIVYVIFNTKYSVFHVFSCCLIIGGGAGNLYDRIFFKSVTDFLYFDFLNLRTSIFNIADVCIAIGTVIIIFKTLNSTKNIEGYKEDVFQGRAEKINNRTNFVSFWGEAD